MDFIDWYKLRFDDLEDLTRMWVADAAWQAAQDELIKSAWKEHGEDFADRLMEIVGRKVEPDWEDEE